MSCRGREGGPATASPGGPRGQRWDGWTGGWGGVKEEDTRDAYRTSQNRRTAFVTSSELSGVYAGHVFRFTKCVLAGDTSTQGRLLGAG